MSSPGLRWTCGHLSRLARAPAPLFAPATRWRLADDYTRRGASGGKSSENVENEDKPKWESLIEERLGFPLKSLGSEPVNPFKLFNLPQQFRIQSATVQREMLNLQRVLHPDHHMGATVRTQTAAGHLSALVNQQYRLLSDPYERAKYLLSAGTEQSREQLELELEKSSKVDPAFLERMMELGELVDGEHSPDDYRKLSLVQVDIESELQQLLGKLDYLFKAKDYAGAKSELAKLKFLSNINSKLVDRLEASSSGNF